MKIKKILTMAVLSCTGLLACKKDNKYNNYTPTNELTVVGPTAEILIEQQKVLTINPQITESIQGGGPYKYKWEIYRSIDLISSVEISKVNPITTATLLSTEKNLNKVITTKPGNYFVHYTITDTKTGLNTEVRYPVLITGKYYEGWWVLEERAGKTALSFLRKDDQLFNNLIAVENPDLTLNGKGVAVYTALHKGLEEVNFFTDQEIYRFSANDFSLLGKSADFFDAPISTPISQAYYKVSAENGPQFIISSGFAHMGWSPSSLGGGPYSDRFTGPDNYSLFPFFAQGASYYALFYDNYGKRFLSTAYQRKNLSLIPKNTSPGITFDMSAVGKTMLFADRGPRNEYFYLMTEDGTDRYLCSVFPDKREGNGIMDKLTNAPEIDKTVAMATSEVNRHLYYATTNKIYRYDVEAKSAKLLYTFPAGTAVKDLKMLKGQGWGVPDLMFNTRLVVATHNGTEGEIYYFDLELIGDIKNNTFSKKFGGFGHIKQISYRYPNVEI